MYVLSWILLPEISHLNATLSLTIFFLRSILDADILWASLVSNKLQLWTPYGYWRYAPNLSHGSLKYQQWCYPTSFIFLTTLETPQQPLLLNIPTLSVILELPPIPSIIDNRQRSTLVMSILMNFETIQIDCHSIIFHSPILLLTHCLPGNNRYLCLFMSADVI